MTQREAKRQAWRAAAGTLRGMLEAGWPWEMQDHGEPPESEEDLGRLAAAMEEIIELCHLRGGL
jgi:hypothetical protein